MTDGLVQIPLIPVTFRNKVRRLQKNLGQEKFHKKLLKIDPLTINQINPKDVQRSIRAYEVKMFTNKSIIKWYKNTKPAYKKKDFYKIMINYPRHLLVEKIYIRARSMLDMGAILEVKKFLNLKLSKEKTISKAIGISEIKDFLKKIADKEEIANKISIKTRQYAKRQMTWARGHMIGWKKIDPDRLDNFLKKI